MELREPVVLMLREKHKCLNHKCESTDARHWGGVARSSGEISVMEMERRGCVRQLELVFNWEIFFSRRRY